MRDADPPHRDADHLQPGQSARLIFDIQTIDEHGLHEVIGERMWVVVKEKIGDTYVGVLRTEPLLPADDGVTLRLGTEVAFEARHVVDVAAA